MFQFSGFAHLSVYYVFNIVGCPIQVSTDQFVCANPRSFSQLITSFIASESLGIPHTPLFCLLYLFIKYPICIEYPKFVLSILFNIFSFLNMSMNFFHSRELWRITESNRWPPACKAGALASWANPPFLVAANSLQLTVLKTASLNL